MRELKEAMFNTERAVAVDQAMIEDLKARAAGAPRHRFRLCLHHAPEDAVQEMIIAQLRASYCRPHCHPDTSTSVQLLEGDLTVMLFDNEGHVTERIDLGPRDTGKCFCLRLEPGCWHMDVPRSEVSVTYETMAGPFVKGRSNVFAEWAPDDIDTEAVAAFLESIGLE